MSDSKTTDKKKRQALEGKRLNAFAMDPEDLTIVGLDTDDGKEHPLYDKRIKLPLNEALVKNIRVNGVLMAVKVRKNGDTVEVVDGRQRVRACRAANEALKNEGCEPIYIPVMMERGSDDRVMGVMISTNELRENDSIASKLDKLERYLALGRTEEDAATQFGVSNQTIKNWLALMEAGPEVKKAVDSGLLSATAGSKIASLPREEQAEAVTEATKNGQRVSVEKATRIAKAKKNGEAVQAALPSKKLLKKIIDSAGLSDEQTNILRWVVGDLAASSIKGLTGLIKEVSAAARGHE